MKRQESEEKLNLLKCSKDTKEMVRQLKIEIDELICKTHELEDALKLQESMKKSLEEIRKVERIPNFIMIAVAIISFFYIGFRILKDNLLI